MINNLEEKYSLALLYLDNENTLDESINILQDLFKKKFKDYEIGLAILNNFINDEKYYTLCKNIFSVLLYRYKEDIDKLNLVKKIGYYYLLWKPSKYNLTTKELNKYQKDYSLLLSDENFLKTTNIDFFMFNVFSDVSNIKKCKFLIDENTIKEHRKIPLNLYNNNKKKIAFLFSPKDKTPSLNSFFNVLKYLSRIDNTIILYIDNSEDELNSYEKDCIKNLNVNYIKNQDNDALFLKILNDNIDILVSMYGHYNRYNILLRKPCKVIVSGYEGGMVFPKYFIDYNIVFKNSVLKSDENYNFIQLNDIFPVLKKTDFKLTYKEPIFDPQKVKIGLIISDLKLSEDLILFIIKLLKNNNVMLTIYSFVKKEYFQKKCGIYDESKLLITTYNNDNNYALKDNLFYLDSFFCNNHSTSKEILGSYRPIISFYNRKHLFGMYSKTLIVKLNMMKELCRDNVSDYYDLVIKYVNSEKEYYKMYKKFVDNLNESGLINNKIYAKQFYKAIDNIKLNKFFLKDSNDILYNIHEKIIIIVTPPAMLYISNILLNIFENQMMYKCIIINHDELYFYIKKYEENINCIFLIYCLFLCINEFPILPINRYIIYNLEQHTNNTLNNNYYNIKDDIYKLYKNSLFNLDYCYHNINFLKKQNIEVNYLPVPISNKTLNYKKSFIKKYDIVFIGSLNKRRKNILDLLKKKYKIYIINNKHNEELIDIYKKSKILLNIHYYDDAIFERCRINEALYNNMYIISEKSNNNDVNIHNNYNKIVKFINIIEGNNIKELCNVIDKTLKYKNKYFIKNSKIINSKIKYLHNKFKKYLNLYFNKNKLFILKKDIAVISCNYGNYDDSLSNINSIKNKKYFDWYYFTDEFINIKNGWNIITKNYYNIDNDFSHKKIHNDNNNYMYSKYIKCKHNKIDLLKKYKYIIHLDGSFEITNINFVNDILSIIRKNIFFIFEHYYRNTIKEEYIESKNIKKYNNQNMLMQIEKYYNNKYIDKTIYESGFFIYKKTNKTIKLMNEWFDEIFNCSFQDQLSLPYIIWKYNINPYFLNENNFIKKNIDGSVWNNKLIGYVREHKINN